MADCKLQSVWPIANCKTLLYMFFAIGMADCKLAFAIGHADCEKYVQKCFAICNRPCRLRFAIGHADYETYVQKRFAICNRPCRLQQQIHMSQSKSNAKLQPCCYKLRSCIFFYMLHLSICLGGNYFTPLTPPPYPLPPLPSPPTLGDTCKRSLSTRGPTPSSPSHSHPPPLPLPSFWYCILFWHSGKCGGTYCGTAYFETKMSATNGCNILTHLLDVTASDMVSGIWL